MSSYVLSLQDVDKTKLAVVGGKGANLGELMKIEGIPVPEGFCISTDAFYRILQETPSMNELLHQLSRLKMDERVKISELIGKIRETLEGTAIPEDINAEIESFLVRIGEDSAYAIRSSATAEDLPSASFAGQQDTYLNIIGIAEIRKYIIKCMASLFSERAVIYRLQNNFDHRKVHLAVIVQKMVYPKAAGVLFTADPVTFNRKVVSIDAGFGLGEALVSGLVNADNYKVCNGKVIETKISVKEMAIYPLEKGGTTEQKLAPELQSQQVLSEKQILQLECMGRKLEEHFGCPQDIEWCLADDVFYIVQSRPITTLYPIPEVADSENHVYISVGHQQMMTDPLKPLGMSVYQMTSIGTRYEAGGRLFVDVAQSLATSAGRKALMSTLGQSEHLMKDAILTIIERGDFIRTAPEDEGQSNLKGGNSASTADSSQNKNNSEIVTELIKNNQILIEELKKNIQHKSGTELFHFIQEDILQLKSSLTNPQSMRLIMEGFNTTAWINEKMYEWLGEKNAADILSYSVANNITSEMGLELMNVADIIRPYPQVISYLQQVKEDDFLEKLEQFEGGNKVRDAIYAYLNKYGMRCSGEIDITKPRWSEKPAILLPMLLNNIKNFEPNASYHKFEQGLKEASRKEQELLERLKQLPEGEQKVKETKEKIDILRAVAGYREYPKYGIVSRYFIYKQALLKEINLLAEAGVIAEKEDAYYLTFEELRDAVHTKKVEYQVVNQRKEEFKLFEKLTPPRVFTSDGEIITGSYKRTDLPTGALAGLAVSSGCIEGRARVVLKIEDAELEEGDILVTTFTDPSWTPLFVTIKGLVTEVGGLMTHGAVIAREYGLPAIVGVVNATKLIKDGQRIRVHGTEGYVEILIDR
ncbi:phosphoenolpyruvate synthase [Anaerocolumna chitinilytica]|uniref:Rifampicin phosphotransferase n=1 Tax=Anaerocolumna chitinilytica TaxID=1727145 RepID=A0A7I8DLQ4_9FIRM|nr:phosphoenolpyruvate synthase [Anaerocolumna chitinilytica]BCJ98667.1 phosphoenolpyruvate synthase [Anaerocolumna chitinilytica]